jgi:hypothetical protein
MNRRKWMTLSAMTLAAGRAQAQGRQAPRQTTRNQQPPAGGGIPLEQYEPKSMLHVPRPGSRVPVSR